MGRARVWQRFLKHTQKQAVSQSQGQRNAVVWALRQGRPGGRKEVTLCFSKHNQSEVTFIGDLKIKCA